MEDSKLDKSYFIPQRYVVALLTMVALTVVYMMRISVPVSSRHMVAPMNATRANFSTCPEPSPVVKTSYHIQDIVFPWTTQKQLIIKHCFFAGYFIGHFPGGIISDLYGGKHVMSVAILVSSLITLLTPIVFKAINGELILVSITKVLRGISIGMIFPSAHSIISQWCPARDRGKITGIIFAATQWSVTINNVVTEHLIMTMESWSSSYYLYGSMGVVLLLVWLLFASSHPDNCPYLTQKEYNYLKEELGKKSRKKCFIVVLADHVQYGPKPVPWARLLQSLPLWSLVLAQIGHTWIWHGLESDLPKYLRDVLKADILHRDLMASIPYAFMGLTTIFMGYVSDYLINRNNSTITTLRKALTTFGAMGPGIFIVAAGYNGYVSCNRTTAAIIFTFGLCIMSCYYAGTRVNCFDLAPNYSGIVMALANGFGALPGIVAPEVTAIFTKHASVYGWMFVFWIDLGVLAVTNMVFVFFGSAEEQPWNRASGAELDENYSQESTEAN
nr:PREDICTED: sialin isoform X2 [Tribolium castaneum]|eukprot:XP_015838377.1 PREDICTED: sialin isoform X2 [Tribolium castaneum]